MTQSLILPTMSASIAMDSSSIFMGRLLFLGIISRAKRRMEAHPMSQSTSASVGFSIRSNQPPENEIMQQSQIINNMFENSDLTKTSRPPGAVTPASSSSMSVHSVPSSIGYKGSVIAIKNLEYHLRFRRPLLHPPFHRFLCHSI